MRFYRGLPAVIALSLLGSAALADWRTVQSNGTARAIYQEGRYELLISCSRGRGFEMWLKDLSLSGAEFRGVRSLMMWVKLPDGRTDRWPVDIIQEGPGISGELVVSDFNLDFFRYAQSFRLDSPQTGRTFLAGDMKGTGAARLAFLEHCGL